MNCQRRVVWNYQRSRTVHEVCALKMYLGFGRGWLCTGRRLALHKPCGIWGCLLLETLIWTVKVWWSSWIGWMCIKNTIWKAILFWQWLNISSQSECTLKWNQGIKMISTITEHFPSSKMEYKFLGKLSRVLKTAHRCHPRQQYSLWYQ
jgi:hypothetical protein